MVVLLVAALVALSACSGPAVAASGPTIARLEVTIQTTSPWTSVMLTPGRVAVQRVTSVPSDVSLAQTSQGWTLNSSAPAGQIRTVTLRAVYEETTMAPNIRITVTKGYAGKTVADIRNSNYESFQAAYVFNQMPLPSTGTPGAEPFSTYITRSRAEFFGEADPPLTHADPRPLVLAAYYPWWHSNAYSNPQLSDQPAGPRSTLQYPGVLSMTQQARSAGIDGFIVSWYGEEYSGWRFDLALRAAEETSGFVIPYLEMEELPSLSNGKADPYATIDSISQALTRSDSPAFLRSDGVPVIFVFSMPRLTAWGWNNVLNELNNRGTPVRLVGDAALDTNYGAIQWGVYRYDPNVMTPEELARFNRDTMLDARLLATSDPTGPHLTVATVSPGYDDTNFRGDAGNPTVERGPNGERYIATWDAAVGADPDWIMITSWNEWFEGTFVEPSVTYGDLALQQTGERAALWSP